MELRTSFRGKLLLLALLPLAFAQLVTILAVMRTVETDVYDQARDSLRIGATVAEEYLSGRADQLRTSVEILAADFGLKEAVATGDADTIRSVLENHSRRVGADVALLLDLDGRPVAGTEAAAEYLHSIGRLIDDPDAQTAYQSTVEISDHVYQAFSVPLRAPTPIGWVVMGFRVDTAVTGKLAALTGLDVALVTADSQRLLAGSYAASVVAGMTRSLLPAPGMPQGVYLIAGGDTSYLATSTHFVARDANDAGVRVVLLRSLTEAMAPYNDARRGLIAFGVALLVIVAIAGAWVSGSIARPLNALTEAVRNMISGNYGVEVRISSRDEVGELASSFNAMRSAIAEREQRISHQALHDRLTDLPNHSNISAQLQRLLDRAVSEQRKVFVLSIRLSRMSAIASTLGHSAGDELIRLAARHLRINLDPGEVLGHVGTEEFVVIVPDSESDTALECAERLRSILAAGVTLDRVNISLQSEIGIAGFPEHGRVADDLLRNASIARSEADARGEPVAIFQRGREDYYVRQLRIVNDLRGAFHREDVKVWYQPQVCLADGRPCGAEALVRWQHAEYGWLPPDEFVSAAEEAGTIVHLTRYVLRKAIAECRRWQDQGHVLQISVNISARDLADDYLPYLVLQLLKEQGLEPQRLTLEVTENSVVQHLRRAITVLECLRDVGIRISMDDFGTGQSSLAQLRNIPLHELKIDKSFVMTLPENRQNEAIVRTTLDLAHSLGLQVVAEGVENEQALRFLSGAGCEQAQGFFLSKPVPADKILDWLAGYKPVTFGERRRSERPFRRKA